MGTRSLTRVIETYKDNKTQKQVKIKLINMYRQYDGYPSGMGMDLVEFLDGSKVVNGMGMDEVKSKRVFNGAGCLAAQLVAHFKDGAGGIYIEPITAKDCGQEYEYEIVVDSDTKETILKCIEVGYMAKNRKGEDIYVNKKRVLFEGKANEFEAFVEGLQNANA
jgi:hypothetical protein